MLNLHGSAQPTTILSEKGNPEEKLVEHIRFSINLSICEMQYYSVILTLVKVQSQAETSLLCWLIFSLFK